MDDPKEAFITLRQAIQTGAKKIGPKWFLYTKRPK